MAGPKACPCLKLDDWIQLALLLISCVVLLILSVTLSPIRTVEVGEPQAYNLTTVLELAREAPGNSCRIFNLNLGCVKGITSIAVAQCGPTGCNNGLAMSSNLNFQHLTFQSGYSIQECRNLGVDPNNNAPLSLYSMTMWDDSGLVLTPAQTLLLFSWSNESGTPISYGPAVPPVAFRNARSVPPAPYPSDPYNSGMLNMTEELIYYSQLPSVVLGPTHPNNLESIVANIRSAEAGFLNGLPAAGGNPNPYNFDVSSALVACSSNLQMICSVVAVEGGWDFFLRMNSYAFTLIGIFGVIVVLVIHYIKIKQKAPKGYVTAP